MALEKSVEDKGPDDAFVSLIKKSESAGLIGVGIGTITGYFTANRVNDLEMFQQMSPAIRYLSDLVTFGATTLAVGTFVGLLALGSNYYLSSMR